MAEPLEELYEEEKDDNSPPEAAIARRAKSYSDFYDIVKLHIEKDKDLVKRRRWRRKNVNLSALAVEGADTVSTRRNEPITDTLKDELLEASQQEYLYATRSYTGMLLITGQTLPRSVGHDGETSGKPDTGYKRGA